MSTSIEQLPLAISLHNAAGHAVLNIPDAPQAMVLELTNRSADDLHTTALGSFDPDDPHHHVRLSFRPGSLRGLDDIHVAPESSSAWRIHTFVAEDGTQVLSLRTVHRLAWSPGEVVAIRLGGVSADHRGGTRPSRVEAATSALVREADDGAVDVTGIQLLPLDIARSRVGAFDEARRLRSGSIATWGPITAGFPEGPGVVGNGQGLSTLRLRLVNTSSGPLHMSGDDDQASRIELGWRHGTPTAPWGLVGGSGDHITVTTYEPGQDEAAAIAGRAWRVDGPVLRCRWDHSWAPGEWLDVELDLHTGVPPGDTQVLVRFVDIPGLDDGELVLLAQVAPLATFPHGTVAVEPLDLWGARGALQFHGSDYLADEDVPHSTISLVAEPQDGDPGDHRLRIQSPSPVEITGGLAVQQDLDVGRELTVDGTATVNSTLRAQAGLHVTGPLRVTGPATVTSDMTARQDLRVGRELTVTRNL